MKNSLFAAAALLFTATAASAQISPSEPQRAGTLNQTTVQPPNPANPTTNPGTLDQRTPTTSNPTQTSIPGAIDQRPAVNPASRTGSMRRGTNTQTGVPRNTTNGRRVRTMPDSGTNTPTTTPTTTMPAGTTRP